MGLSSSAAFELLIARILNTLFNEGKISPLDLAKAGQYAETTYFCKPSGLLDQLTVSYEEIVYADFSKASPVLKTLNSKVFDDLDIFIINTGKSHGSLTEHYKAIVDDMARVASHYHKKLLSEVDENKFNADYVELSLQLPRISLERATHYFTECHRVEKAVKDLEEGNLSDFLTQLNESGKSSNELLHNLTYPGDKDKVLQTMYLKLKEMYSHAAVRVHGGGFAGTILVIAKKEDHIGPSLHEFINTMKRKKVLDIAPSKHFHIL
jgi:galactokinase